MDLVLQLLSHKALKSYSLTLDRHRGRYDGHSFLVEPPPAYERIVGTSEQQGAAVRCALLGGHWHVAWALAGEGCSHKAYWRSHLPFAAARCGPRIMRRILVEVGPVGSKDDADNDADKLRAAFAQREADDGTAEVLQLCVDHLVSLSRACGPRTKQGAAGAPPTLAEETSMVAIRLCTLRGSAAERPALCCPAVQRALVRWAVAGGACY